MPSILSYVLTAEYAIKVFSTGERIWLTLEFLFSNDSVEMMEVFANDYVFQLLYKC